MGSTYFIKRVFKTKRKPKYGRDRAKRPKTFKTEEAAKKWAESQKMKGYSIVNMHPGRKTGKIRVVAKE